MRHMHRNIIVGLFSLIVMAFVSADAFAETGRRVALLIGNQNYQNVSSLANPHNDVTLLSGVLKEAGFTSVDVVTDLDLESMQKALRDFEDLADGAEVAVVYYSGHGMEMNGLNYMIPVDAVLKSDRDVADETMVLSRLERALSGATRLKLVILDACRDNPFETTMTRTVSTRSLTRGLAKVEPVNPDMLIAFASRAGTVALDGSGENSPFALALSRFLVEPGLDIRIALGKVRDYVIELTDRQQEPFVYGSLGGARVVLNVKEMNVTIGAEGQGPSAAADWENIRDIADEQLIAAFLERHGSDPVYKLLAEKRLEMLNNANEPINQSPDDIAWEAVRGSSDAAALARFLERYPESRHRRAAESQIVALVPKVKAEQEALSPARRDCYVLAAEPGAIPGYPGVSLKQIDPARALTACAQAVNERPDDGMLVDFLARAQEAGESVREARRNYEKAVELGNTFALTNIGWLYIDGKGVEKDPEHARSLFEEAARAGNPFAQNSLGWLYRYGVGGTEKDAAAALSWHRQAAEQGYAKAMAALGYFYREGQGVDQNYVTSLDWYRKAAEAGDVASLTAVGYAYEQGIGTARDYAEARIWYEKAAKRGDFYAMAALGYLYDAGRGGEQDYIEARYWYEKAAAGGNTYAMTNLARIYDKGFGVKADAAEAANWAIKAAESGDKAYIEKLGTAPETVSAEFVTKLQELLAKRGVYDQAPDGVMNAQTLDALKAIAR